MVATMHYCIATDMKGMMDLKNVFDHVPNAMNLSKVANSMRRKNILPTKNSVSPFSVFVLNSLLGYHSRFATSVCCLGGNAFLIPTPLTLDMLV